MTIWTPDIQGSSGALYRRLADAIAGDIACGRLHPGEKLPTHRDLADILGINVSTVTRGYREAEQRGLLAATVGRGTYVSSDANANTPMVSPESHSSKMIELGLINPLYQLDPSLEDGLKKICRRRDISALLHYSDPGGRPEHRTIGAEWAGRFGLHSSTAGISICSGAQHGLSCILAGLFRPGDRIATDCLTYPGIKTLAAMLEIRLVPVAMDRQGMVAGSLDRICRREKVKAVYLMPGVHNPTTTTISPERRQELSTVVKKHQLLIIEDDAYDLTRPGIIPPLSSLLPEQGIYIAGISKALAAGLRVAFVVVPERYRRAIHEAILNTIWMAPPLNIELITMWIKDGTADKVIESKRREAARRFALAREILNDFSFAGMESGFYIWLDLPAPWRGVEFELRMRELGVNVFGAEKFIVGDAAAPAAARISLSGPRSMAELRTGLELINRVLNGRQKDDFEIAM